jgi:hypothetical protein
VSGVRTASAGPIDVYAQLAILLAGKDISIAAAPAGVATDPEAIALDGGDFLFARLDLLISIRC